jgi:hypothetical protein
VMTAAMLKAVSAPESERPGSLSSSIAG